MFGIRRDASCPTFAIQVSEPTVALYHRSYTTASGSAAPVELQLNMTAYPTRPGNFAM